MIQEIRTEIRRQTTDKVLVQTKRYPQPLDAILGLAMDLGYVVKKEKNKIIIGG